MNQRLDGSCGEREKKAYKGRNCWGSWRSAEMGVFYHPEAKAHWWQIWLLGRLQGSSSLGILQACEIPWHFVIFCFERKRGHLCLVGVKWWAVEHRPPRCHCSALPIAWARSRTPPQIKWDEAQKTAEPEMKTHTVLSTYTPGKSPVFCQPIYLNTMANISESYVYRNMSVPPPKQHTLKLHEDLKVRCPGCIWMAFYHPWGK